MSPINSTPSPAANTGWVLYDWTGHASRPTFTRIAGDGATCRVQLDRYRRQMQMHGWGAQVQLWVWATSTFEVWSRYDGTTTTRGPQVYPEAVTVETAITPREYRVTLSTDGFNTAVWGSGTYQTSVTTAAVQMTIAGRFFGQYTYTTAGHALGRQIWFAAGAGVRVRCLIIGQHNADWRSDGMA